MIMNNYINKQVVNKIKLIIIIMINVMIIINY